MRPRGTDVSLSDPERALLLHLARAAIRDALVHDGCLRDALDGAEFSAAMRERRALFVTLKLVEGETLRGCMGTMKSTRRLIDALVDTAPMAALRDPRFPPLTVEELERVQISISVLTPMQPLQDVDALVPGRHGVELSRGEHRAVFLPQVADEQGWDRVQLLRNLALKAGLDAEAWRTAELSTFEAEAFSEAAAQGCSKTKKY